MTISTLTAEVDANSLKPTYLGPTWAHEDGGFGPTPCNAECAADPHGLTPRWLLPEKTLGWQIAGWCAEYLLADDGGPWKFTPEQLRFILWWYAVDNNGRFVYRTGVLQRLKGWG